MRVAIASSLQDLEAILLPEYRLRTNAAEIKPPTSNRILLRDELYILVLAVLRYHFGDYCC